MRNDDQPAASPLVMSIESCEDGTVEINFHAPPFERISTL